MFAYREEHAHLSSWSRSPGVTGASLLGLLQAPNPAVRVAERARHSSILAPGGLTDTHAVGGRLPLFSSREGARGLQAVYVEK